MRETCIFSNPHRALPIGDRGLNFLPDLRLSYLCKTWKKWLIWLTNSEDTTFLQMSLKNPNGTLPAKCWMIFWCFFAKQLKENCQVWGQQSQFHVFGPSEADENNSRTWDSSILNFVSKHEMSCWNSHCCAFFDTLIYAANKLLPGYFGPVSLVLVYFEAKR